jgi:signal transduction histidine kinase
MRWFDLMRTCKLPLAGYLLALIVPVGLTLAVAAVRLPPFMFEHIAVLMVVGFALRWGVGVAVVASLVAVGADNVVLREPFGQPTITGVRDLVDLVLFVSVGAIISLLVTRLHAERAAAQDAAERERRAREDRDRLIDAVSHDLATPLSVITANLQFARLQRASELDLDRLLTRVETATLRATALTRTLADAKALDSDGLQVDLHPLDLRAVVTPIVKMFDRLSDRHSVLVAVPDDHVPVLGDASRLSRVIENLINNAIKYSPDGGSVEVSLTLEGAEAVVRVRDYGIGISAHALPHIFERSYRAPEASARAAGLGLGLSIAAEIVKRHLGSIEAATSDPCGATFTVRLPLHTAPASSRIPQRLRSAH